MGGQTSGGGGGMCRCVGERGGLMGGQTSGVPVEEVCVGKSSCMTRGGGGGGIVTIFNNKVFDYGEHGCRLLFLGEERLPSERELTPLCKVHTAVW